MGGTAGALELGRSGMPHILAQPATNPSPFKQPSGPVAVMGAGRGSLARFGGGLGAQVTWDVVLYRD